MTTADLPVQMMIFVFCTVVFTLVTAWTDLRERKIYNKATLPMWLAGWLYQAVFLGWHGIQIGMAGFVCGFGVLFVLWRVGAAGGGDVKLMGALGVWLGADGTLKVTLISLFIVASVTCARSLCLVVSGKNRLPVGVRVIDASNADDTTQTAKQAMGYAAPVAVATWGMLFWSSI